jgi:hypothetical protein
MIGAAQIADAGARLAARAGPHPPAAWDLRVDWDGLDEDPGALRHAKHQVLMRAYQARYMLLPDASPGGCIVERLRRHHDPVEMAALEALRHGLEAELIGPQVAEARLAAAGRDLGAYVRALLPELRARPEDSFIAALRASPHGEAHYRNFLVQSSADLLAEASASALGVAGEFGPAQSALFCILIDEFGYGTHGRKHSVLYRATMRGFGLCDTYNACWPLFDTGALELHNAIHHLFQNPRNFFMQVGFLLFAETAYQRSTLDHFRYLREFHPEVDARYFGEHAHIDLHHTRMVIEEVAVPLVAAHGPAAGAEIVAGAEFTRRAFDAAGAHLLAVTRAFDIAAACGKAVYAAPDLGRLGAGVTPATALSRGPVALQVGGIGVVTDARAFALFPPGAFGRRLVADA